MAAVLVTACEDKENIQDAKTQKTDCNYQQRWIMKDYQNTMKIFTDSLVYTVYDIDGEFGEISDAIPNPLPVWTKGDSLFIQRRRTEIDAYKMEFKCDCNVMNLTNKDGFTVGYFREGFNLSTCP